MAAGASEAMSWRLYVDIGNSAVKFGVPAVEGWAHVERHDLAALAADLDADGPVPEDTLAHIGEEFVPHVRRLAPEAMPPEAVVVVCSNRKVTDIPGMLAAGLRAPLRQLGRDLRYKIRSRYNLAQLGADRLANIVGALDYGGLPAVIIDAGSCVTIDVLDRQGLHLGGMIMPGQPALTMGIAMVAPQLMADLDRAKRPSGHLGKSTTEALGAGLLAATVGQMTHAMDVAEAAVEPDGPMFIFCGGDAPPLAAEFGGELVEWLTLDGLRFIDEAAYPPS